MNSGAWWKGYNDARRQHDYFNNHILRVDKFEYQQGYLTGDVGFPVEVFDRNCELCMNADAQDDRDREHETFVSPTGI